MELNTAEATQETGPYSEADQQVLQQEEGQQQEQQPTEELIGGKFKSADDLLEAYQALEKQLGERSGYQQADGEEEVQETEEDKPQETPVLGKEDEDAILESIGGEENFKRIQEWAKGSLNEDELEAYNREVGSGDYFRARNALHSMTYAYRESNGSEPELIGGKLSSRTSDVFRSNQEVVAAMSDPRYLSDDAYTKDIEEKLNRSDVLVPN